MTDLFVEHGGYRVINVDAVGHEALEHNATQIIARFGNEIVQKGGAINRKRLGAIVFRDRNALRQLEEIVHPWMKRRVADRLKELQAHNVVIDAALLCYLGLDRLCNAVIWVNASFMMRIRRARRRDRVSLSGVMRMMRMQKRLKLTRHTTDTYIISNNMSKKRFLKKSTQQLRGLWS